ncbi:MAG: hypothetical protein L0Y72_11140 [Gemmataceae bacterium]|nr:hypothetical protein [Gemmataceae bacterium]MCI0641892.1 hypothetical protein [Gemmataceae bacterium]MCI0739591.1 hypothetical protein [Gemmataceae bacterium]
MPSEQPLLIALGITFGLTALFVLLLRRPMRGFLTESSGSENRAAFWTNYATCLVLLAPMITVLVGRPSGVNVDSLLLHVLDHAKWGLLGLLGSLLAVGFFAAVFARRRGATVFVHPEQMDDLQRLMSKVEEIRARNILRRAPEREQKGA